MHFRIGAVGGKIGGHGVNLMSQIPDCTRIGACLGGYGIELSDHAIDPAVKPSTLSIFSASI